MEEERLKDRERKRLKRSKEKLCPLAVLHRREQDRKRQQKYREIWILLDRNWCWDFWLKLFLLWKNTELYVVHISLSELNCQYCPHLQLSIFIRNRHCQFCIKLVVDSLCQSLSYHSHIYIRWYKIRDINSSMIQLSLFIKNVLCDKDRFLNI